MIFMTVVLMVSVSLVTVIAGRVPSGSHDSKQWVLLDCQACGWREAKTVRVIPDYHVCRLLLSRCKLYQRVTADYRILGV